MKTQTKIIMTLGILFLLIGSAYAIKIKEVKGGIITDFIQSRFLHSIDGNIQQLEVREICFENSNACLTYDQFTDKIISNKEIVYGN